VALGAGPVLWAIAGPVSIVAPITAATTKTTVLRTLAPFAFPSLTTDKTRRARPGCVPDQSRSSWRMSWRPASVIEPDSDG